MAVQLFRSRRVLLPDGLQEAGMLVGADGRITQVLRGAEVPRGVEVLDAGDLVIMPGLVDSHVHVNEPGRSHWEGYSSATRAAAAGGVTTVVDMPLNSLPPTTRLQHLHTKMEAARRQVHVDVGFWGGLVPDNIEELGLLVQAGVVGFKCFLCPSGVPEFPPVVQNDVEAALAKLQGTGTVLAFHAELGEGNPIERPAEYKSFLASRPPDMELEAVRLVARLCAQHAVRCHIVHLSAAEALPLLRGARRNGTLLSVETCHHYLHLQAETVPDGATHFKCCPPVRELQNRERLWAALAAGDLDMVVSDHSPCPPNLKEKDFQAAWGGIASLQLGLPLFWTQARQRGFSLLDAARLLSQAPAELCGLQARKGQISEGHDADFVIWDPDRSFTVTEQVLHHRHKISPYLGMRLDGHIEYTVLRGQVVYHAGKFSEPKGQLLTVSR